MLGCCLTQALILAVPLSSTLAPQIQSDLIFTQICKYCIKCNLPPNLKGKKMYHGTLTASTLIILSVEMLKLKNKNKKFEEQYFVNECN